ncbi:nucleoprotein [Tai orthobunyavirus]|nr:nucleoprotein [Tai orthobunyavirus]
MEGSQHTAVPGGGYGAVYAGAGTSGAGVIVPTTTQPPIPAPDLSFGYGDDRTTSSFNPTTQYLAFKDRYRTDLQPNNIRSFFLHARDTKRKMANINKEKVRVSFGSLTVELVNNHRPGNQNRVVLDHELTLYRLTGFLARFVLDSIAADASWAEGARVIVNPISAKLGLNWGHGGDIYLSTLPGTEMFLDVFHYYPLAFMILRIRRGEIPATMAKKALRQRVGGKLAAQWMAEDVDKVKAAVQKIEELKPLFSGLTQTMAAFLQNFGIRLPTEFK